MIKTLIVDDEPLAHEVVLTYVKQRDDLDVVGQCYAATEALEFLKDNKIDLILLDINMPVLSGLDFLSVLTNKPQIIITSAYQEYALEGFNMDVTDYLLKPFRFDRFSQALEKVKQQLALQQISTNEPGTDVESMFIKVDKKQVQINLTEVSCFEAYGNYVKVWRDGKSLLTPRTLTSFEQLLPEATFVRIHKSNIVNRAHIDYIEADSVMLTDGRKVAIGKQFKHNLKVN